MTVYPQLTTGALIQFPLVKRRRMRTVVNTAADGSSIKLADPAGGFTEWQLRYQGLSDADLSTLQQTFTATEGSLNGFTFVDPGGNLLAWSEDLANAVWTPEPFLAIAGGITDPYGGTSGFSLTNSGAAAQNVTQTLNSPAGYVYSFSIYTQASQPTPVTLLIGSNREQVTVGPAWTRLVFTGSGDPTAASILFGIELPPGGIDVFGPQVEAQSTPSAYKKSTTGGIYENARFADDTFSFTTTDVNRHSAIVNIVYANHL